MATISERLGLHAPTGGDPADVPADIERLRDQLDALLLAYGQGRLRDRPATYRSGGRLYYSTDNGVLYWDAGEFRTGGWMPAGFQTAMIQWTAAQGEPPFGWLRADGSAHLRADYPALFDAINTQFGSDSSTRFNVPNLSGRTAIGTGTGVMDSNGRPAFGTRLTNRGYATHVGTEAHALTSEQNGVHAHSVYDAGHSHNIGSSDMGGGVLAELGTVLASQHQSGGPTYTLATTGTGGAWVGLHAKSSGTGIGIYNSGAGSPHNNVQPSLALNAWIKT